MPAGRKSFEPTEQQRRMVESLAGLGMPHDSIARLVDIDAKTLRKHFRRELDCGADKANAQVLSTLHKMATSGKYPAMTTFWCKTRLGMREVSRVEHTGAGGESLLSIGTARSLLAEAALSRPQEDEDEQPITI
jgi:hypothetical protein